MDPQKSANEIEERKKWLFHVPIPDKAIYPLSFLELLALFARAYSLLCAIAFSLGELIGIALLATYLQPKRLFNARQSLLLGDVFYSLPVLLVYALPRYNFYIVGAALTSYPLTLSYVASVSNPLLFLPIIFIFFLPLLLISKPLAFPFLLAIYASSIALAFLTISKVDSKTLKIIGIKGSRFGASFFRAWFNKTDNEYESFLEQLSSLKRIVTDVFLFTERERGFPLGSLVVTDIHPGPFHDVGSSTLPTVLSSEMERTTGAPCLVLRGKGSHENDIPTKALAEGFAKMISTSAANLLVPLRASVRADDPKEQKVEFEQDKAGPFTVTSFTLNEENLVLLSKAPLPCDDIPQEVGDYLEALGCKVADAHNSGPIDGYSTLNYFPPSNVEQLHQRISDKLSSHKVSTSSDFRVGFSHINARASLKTGICDGGAVAMSWTLNGIKGVLVSFQGNNMTSGLRDKIVDSLKKIGFTHAEVSTTDNHQLSTSLQAVNKYSMVGAEDQRAVINMAVQAARAASDAEKSALVLVQKRLDELKVIGSDSLGKINDAIKAALPVLGRYSLISLITLAAIGISCAFMARPQCRG